MTSDPPSLDLRASTTMTNIACDRIYLGNAHDKMNETSLTCRIIDTLTSYALTATPPPLDIRKRDIRRDVERHHMEGKPQEGRSFRKNLSGWLLFVGIKLRLNILKIHSTSSCIFST